MVAINTTHAAAITNPTSINRKKWISQIKQTSHRVMTYGNAFDVVFFFVFLIISTYQISSSFDERFQELET